MKAELVEVDGYSKMVDGTQLHMKYLWLIAQRGTIFYTYQLYADPEDYSAMYDLAMSIIRSIAIK